MYVTDLPVLAGQEAGDPPAGEARWAQLVTDLADASAFGTRQTWDVGLHAACDLLPAAGAALIRWKDGTGEAVASVGRPPQEFVRRPAEGSGWQSWRPIASVSLDPRHDLVVSREAGPSFSEGDVRVLRAVATLLGWPGPGRRRCGTSCRVSRPASCPH